MKRDSEKVVSIAKVEHSIERAVREAINLAGGMKSVVNSGDEIYLKPNFVAPRSSYMGVTTNFEVIRVAAEEVRRCGGIPILFETPAIEFDKRKVYDVLGVFDFAKKNEIQLADGENDLITVPVSGGRVLKKLRVPRTLYRSKIINLPKLKTHVSAKMTCGMKNLIGLLPTPEKRRVHVRGVHEAIADISKVFQPVFTIVDATTCMEGDGPTYGEKVNLGLIIAGKDALATDKVCCRIIGLLWEKVEYLRLSSGAVNEEHIKIAGECLSNIKCSFRIPQKTAMFHLLFRLMYIFDVLFSKISSKPLNQFLYDTGHIGTNPQIVKNRCDRCYDCLGVCPEKDALNLEDYRIDYKKCIRCLNCFYACKAEAIIVKGMSHPIDQGNVTASNA